MMEVWKYHLSEDNTIEMPRGAKILCLQMQNGKPTIWAMVNPKMPRQKRRFMFVDTGETFDAHGLTYIGTVQDDVGYVSHVFERSK